MQSALVKLSRHVQRLRTELEATDGEGGKDESEMKQGDEDEEVSEFVAAHRPLAFVWLFQLF